MIAHWLVPRHIILRRLLALFLSHFLLCIDIHTKNDASGIKALSWMITSVIPRGVRFVFANIAQESPIQLDRSDVFNETLGADTSTLRQIHRTFQNTPKMWFFESMKRKMEFHCRLKKELIEEMFLDIF